MVTGRPFCKEHILKISAWEFSHYSSSFIYVSRSQLPSWFQKACVWSNHFFLPQVSANSTVRCARQHEISLQSTQNSKVQSTWLLSWVALSLFWGNIFAFASTNASVCDSSVSFSDLFSWVGWESMNPLRLVTKLSVVLCPLLCLREFDTTLHTERPLEEFVHRCHGIPQWQTHSPRISNKIPIDSDERNYQTCCTSGGCTERPG